MTATTAHRRTHHPMHHGIHHRIHHGSHHGIHGPHVAAGRAHRPQRAERDPVALRRPVPAATYRRRRAVVGGVLAVVVACGVVLAHDVLAPSGGVPASAAAGGPAPADRTVTAQPGDSLWSIAAEHRGEVPIGRYVDALVTANGGPSIQAGQAVVLP